MSKKSRVRENSRLDAWWEHHYGDCRCYEIMCDRDGEELPCRYCKREAEQEAEQEAEFDRLSHMAHAPRAPAPPPSPHQAAMDFIRGKLDAFQAAKGVDAQLPILRELFEGCLSFRDFFAATPRMCEALEKKVTEFRADERVAELFPLFDQVKEMLDSLPSA